MTTIVIVKSPSPNDLDLLIEEIAQGRGITKSTRVREGEEMVLQVDASSGLRITEIAREEPQVPPESPEPSE